MMRKNLSARERENDAGNWKQSHKKKKVSESATQFIYSLEN